MNRSPALLAYLAISRLAGPLARPLLARRAARGKEDPARLGERLGVAGMARPTGRLLWLHGASVGEATAMLPLIDALKAQAPDATCLVTTGTVTAARRMAALLPAGCLHQFVPVDTAAAVHRFLRHWHPDLAIWTESELWPRLMVETARADVPMALVNARLSERSAQSWGRAPGMARALLGLFELIVPQEAETLARLVALGVEPDRLRPPANLKALAPIPECDAGELARLRAALGERPVWLAASTHAPEEALAAEAHRIAARDRPGLLTIVALRHPDRGAEVAAEIAALGLRVTRRSQGEGPTGDVWLADTLGEMGLWFRLAPVAFVGGSLAPMGGHTPFEPAALGSAILHGPDTRNFAPAYAKLDAAGGARAITDARSLAAAVVTLTRDAVARQRMAKAATAVRRQMTPDTAAMARELLALARGAP